MQFEIINKDSVSSASKVIFESLDQSIGNVPNLIALMAYSANGLIRHLSFHSSASSLNKKEKEIINLVVSQVNNSSYCTREHSYIAAMNGTSDGEIISIRKGNALNLR